MKKDLKDLLQEVAGGAGVGLIGGVILLFVIPEVALFLGAKGAIAIIAVCTLAGAVVGLVLARRWHNRQY